MGKTFKDSRVTVHGSPRRQADSRRLARLVIELAQAQAEADAQALHGHRLARPKAVPRPKVRRRRG